MKVWVMIVALCSPRYDYLIMMTMNDDESVAERKGESVALKMNTFFKRITFTLFLSLIFLFTLSGPKYQIGRKTFSERVSERLSPFAFSILSNLSELNKNQKRRKNFIPYIIQRVERKKRSNTMITLSFSPSLLIHKTFISNFFRKVIGW